MEAPEPKQTANATSQTRPAQAIPRIDVQSLMQGKNQVVLVFHGVEYLLRVTRQQRLLLTK